MIKEIEMICELSRNFKNYQAASVPLCAAENVMSHFVKLPLSGDFQERYIMGSAYEYSITDNFIGSEMLLPYYKQIDELGRELFHAKYTDARTLSGMNAVQILASSLMKPGDNVMLLGKEWGGHASMRPTFERLGANIFYAPYSWENYDFDYSALNFALKEKNIQFLNIAPSDIIYPFDLGKIDDSTCTVLVDYSQLLGLIACELIKNPLDELKNVVLYGGTHKTMPGPAHGIIMTNSDKIYSILDKNITPKFLRNVHMHQIVSLLFTLIEMKYFGRSYQENTVRIGNVLGAELETLGLKVVRRKKAYTETHQLFLEIAESTMRTMFTNAVSERITLNTKQKPLFHGGFGIRLGQQEISRYAWDDDAVRTIAKILVMISQKEYDKLMVRTMIANLPPKIVKFTFDESEYAGLVQ